MASSVGRNAMKRSSQAPVTWFFKERATIGTTTLEQTNAVLIEEHHPKHIITRRRLEAWDPRKLHWAIKCPQNVSKKKVVRNWAVRRVREALVAELRKNGYDRDGKAKDVASSNSHTQPAIIGSLQIAVNSDVLVAPITDIREQCEKMVQKVVRAQKGGK